MHVEKPRQIAFRALQRHAESSDYIEDILADELRRTQLSGSDRSLTHELVCGVVRFQRALDWLIDLRTEGRPQQPIVRTILRLGLYQLLWLERVPPHAAVHETVEIAKTLNLGPIAGFLNAILRNVAGAIPEHRQKLAELEISQPDVHDSHPAWLFRRWSEHWGREKARELMKWNNTPPPIYARVNTLKTDPQTLEQTWLQEGVSFARREFPWTGTIAIYELLDYPPIASLKSFTEGGFYVQDPSTLLAVMALDPQPGDTVLDLCAAPGGKTTLMAQLMKNQGRIFAQDTHRARLLRLKDNCTRLGVNIVKPSSSTGVSHPELSLSFDRILVDAPCSNTGVARRRIDLRWRVKAEEINRLQETQKDLLRDAAVQLKPGGVLVYSTCSLEPEENHTITKWFVAQDQAFRCVQEQQLKPFEHRVDGAYVAVFRKRNPASHPN